MFYFLELFLLAAMYLTLKNQNRNKTPQQFCWNSPTNCSTETNIRLETCLPQKNFFWREYSGEKMDILKKSCSSCLGAGRSAAARGRRRAQCDERSPHSPSLPRRLSQRCRGVPSAARCVLCSKGWLPSKPRLSLCSLIPLQLNQMMFLSHFVGICC